MNLDVIGILKNTVFFEGLNEGDLTAVISQAQRRKFSSGTRIIEENAPGDFAYVVLAGKVQISKTVAVTDRQVIHVCEPGDFFGEMSLLEDKPRSAEATAIEESELLLLSKEHFESLLIRFPTASLNMLRVVSGRLRETDEMLIDVLEARTRKLKEENLLLHEEITRSYPTNITSRSPAMQQILDMAKKAAANPVTVLLLGESGTGKEVMAREVHRLSDRANKPFIAINCAAIPAQLLESELFGHEKGSFTGAAQMRKGKFELANGGTVFLDEIGDMAEDTQAKMLRFLQEHEFERVGGSKTIRVDVRVLAATNRDLEQAIEEQTFRSDLYYRLNVISFKLAPLRERKEDMPDLMEYFLNRFTEEMKKPLTGFAEDVLAACNTYNWPGNIRELSNVIERAVALSDTEQITLADLPPSIGGAQPSPAAASIASPLSAESLSYHDAVEAAKQSAISSALDQTGGNQSRAAELLGIGRTYLSRLMKQFGMR